jgi:mRNA interferase HigB
VPPHALPHGNGLGFVAGHLTNGRIVTILVTRDCGDRGTGWMHIITRSRLTAFGRRHQDAAKALRDWAKIVRRKRYARSAEVRADFPSVDFLGPHKAVFNIRGNSYRLIVDIRFDLGRVYVRHVVTHTEYDRLMKQNLL